MIARVFLFLVLFVITFSFPWWVSVPLMILYMLRYTAYEIIVLGALFDAQFSNPEMFFPALYTLLLGIFFVAIELLKPFLSFYQSNE